MKMTKLFQNKVNSIGTIVPIAVCAFAITLTSVAQQAAPAPAAAAPNKAQNVQLKPPTIPALKAGQAMAFDLCNGNPVQTPKNFTDAVGLKMDTMQTPCGEQQSTSPQVSGGNPPYTFHWDSWGFPPLGMQLGQNGLLYGTPAPHIGDYQPFSVCAKDMGGHDDCHEVTISKEPAPQVKAHSKAPLYLGLLAGGGVAAVVAARTMNSTSSSGSGDVTGTCSGLSPVNACGPCTCTDDGNSCNDAQCGGGADGMCFWAGPGSAVGNAPWCANGQPD